jgi:formylglycine-generating enzyme
MGRNDMTKTSLGKKIRLFLICTSIYAFYPLYTFAQIENNMVLIPSGKLIVSEGYKSTEIFVEKFFMDRFEVTQESYEIIIGHNPSFFVDKKKPVEMVNWFEAVEYCLQIGKRLPNEYEWEMASRSGGTLKFYWGKGDPKLYGWFNKNSEKKTHPVGQKKPNSYGLFDMSGNVWEWTDSYHETISGKVLRGGSWRNSMNAMQSAKWITSLPIHRFHYVGFRCASSKLLANSN